MSADRDTDRNARIDALVDDFVARHYSGTPIAAETLVDANPDIADELAARLASAEVVLGSSTTGDAADRGSDSATISASPDPDAEPGTGPTISGYSIIREIHRGGQGVVYQALQESTRRKVAIKVMREGPFAGAADRARFDREIRVLGQLKHPNIVAIHDTGSAAGCFYFVMDYIRGEPLDRYLANQRLAVDEVLALFGKICTAVNAAHLRGFIHRDLKPGNILIDSASEPHVLDFGLAKIPGADGGAAMTVTGQFIGSLPWASPEQAQGTHDQVDVRTDVYALGVILFQMLTGRFPYDVTGPMRDVLDRIINAEPARPGAYDRRINYEIETIVLKCLAKDRDRRYQSAGELARDVQHYLKGEPLEARRDSQWYVLRKTLRKYWLPTSVAAAFVLLLAGGAIAMSILYRRADQAAVEAQRQAAKAVEIQDFLANMLATVDPESARGPDVTVRQVLDETSARIEKELADQPLVRAAIEDTIGSTYRALGCYDQAKPHLDAALATRRQRLGNDNLDVAASLDSRGMLASAVGDYALAEKLYTESRNIRARHLGHDDGLMAETTNNLGYVKTAVGDFAAGEKLYREALAIARKQPAGDHTNVANYASNLAVLLRREGRYDEAAKLAREALDTRLRAFGERHIDVAASRNNLAMILYQQHDIPGAERELRAALATYTELLPANHHLIADVSCNLARVVNGRGAAAEAETLYRKALAIYEGSSESNHPRVIIVQNGLAVALKDQGKTEEAERILRDAARRATKHFGHEHTYVAKTLAHLGDVLAVEGKYTDAASTYTEANDILRKTLGDTHPEFATSLTNLARIDMSQKAYDKALPLLRQALAIRRDRLKPDDPDLASSLEQLGRCLLRLGNTKDAEPLLTEALSKVKDDSAAGKGVRNATFRDLIDLYESTQRPALAADLRSRLGETDPRTASTAAESPAEN